MQSEYAEIRFYPTWPLNKNEKFNCKIAEINNSNEFWIKKVKKNLV